MKGPSRPAPAVPASQVNRYSPISNWNDDPFGTDVFEPMPQAVQKKKPPPRPPPPKINITTQPEIPAKPSHFIRKPTALTYLLNRKNKNTTVQNTSKSLQQSVLTDCSTDVDPIKIFPKCEPRQVQTASLIDLSSPPSSPTFTTRSSSDGLSVDSFGSDATSSTNHHLATNGGNASQAESGFEDDFDMFINSRKTINRDDTLDDFSTIDPFSPPMLPKPPVMKKPTKIDYMDVLCNGKNIQPSVLSQKGPTIIRAKPVRPKPPDNAALLKSTFGNNLILPSMTINTTVPLQKINNFRIDNVSPFLLIFY